jgi:hypothetical protein
MEVLNEIKQSEERNVLLPSIISDIDKTGLDASLLMKRTVFYDKLHISEYHSKEIPLERIYLFLTFTLEFRFGSDPPLH